MLSLRLLRCILGVCLLCGFWLSSPHLLRAAPTADPVPLSPADLEQYWAEQYATLSTSSHFEFPDFYEWDVLAKAQPDECFNDVGEPYDGTVPDCEFGQPKVNQAYIWGMTTYSDTVWFGTAPNVHCLVLGAFLGLTSDLTTPSYTCEFGDSQLAQTTSLPDRLGDWRPAKLYIYDRPTAALVDITPNGLTGIAPDLRFLQNTVGIRSATIYGDYVFFAGPAFIGGINVFVYHAATRTYLGSATLPGYTNIRKWLEVDGILYTAVGTPTGGAVLRYTGDPADNGTRFQFATVGNLDADGAEIALHDGRLFVNTWPSAISPGIYAGLWMSPPLDGDGLNPADADSWELVFSYDEYEPDPVIAATYGGGALHSFNGDLFWGTMHVPFLSTLAHFRVYSDTVYFGSPSEEELVAGILATQRAVTLFQGRDFGTPDQTVEVAYGLPLLPVFDPVDAAWTLAPNGVGMPLYGAAGINNLFNNYTWAMAVYDDQLFIGTMDWSYLIAELLAVLVGDLLPIDDLAAQTLPPDLLLSLPTSTLGADLVRFKYSDVPALPVSLNGMGNYSSYGIRNLIGAPDGLLLGMANPMNLLTDPYDELPEGGWELIQLNYVTLPVQVQRDGNGSGTVTSLPAGLDCSGVCTADFKLGADIALLATPDTGSSFVGWSGDCSGSGPCGGLLLSPKVVTAIFALNSYTLTVTRDGDGSGTVVSDPAGVDCGLTCTATLDGGTVMTLTAITDPGSVFNGWSGLCTGTDACVVTITDSAAVTATFANNRFPLTVQLDGDGSGTVVSLPAGIDCSTLTCTARFDNNTLVQLNAVAATGSAFAGWSGACSGLDACQVIISPAAPVVTATFTLTPAAAAIHVDGTLQPGFTLLLTATLPINPITDCTWDFGDGNTTPCAAGVSVADTDGVLNTQVATTHTYQEAGEYTVVVTANNPAGTVSVSRGLTVLAPTGEDPSIQPGSNAIFLPLLHQPQSSQ